MSARHEKRSFAAPPGKAEDWIRAANVPDLHPQDTGGFTARLTVDTTLALCGRIKIAAFRRGGTIADMLRDLLARGFSSTDGETP